MLALCVVFVVQACDPIPFCHPDEATAKAVRSVSFQGHASWGKTLSHVDFVHLSLYIMGTSQRGSEAQMPTSLRLCHVGFYAVHRVIRLTQPHEEAQGEESSSPASQFSISYGAPPSGNALPPYTVVHYLWIRCISAFW